MKYICSILILAMLGIAACTHKSNEVITNDGNFPAPIAAIMITKCAIAGCHNQASYGNADSLLLDSWEHLFNGSSSGAEVVAYNAQYSPLMYFVNTDSTLGTVVAPTMPYSTANRPLPALSKEEYMTLYNWIQNGAPDKNGNIPFASNPETRQKTYLTQQGCDLLAVIDAQAHVVMRYIPIGMTNAIESPHCVRVSDDGMYAYVSFLAGQYVQKIDTKTDQVISSAPLAGIAANGSWNIVHVSPGDTELLTSDWVANGLLVAINANTMRVDSQRTWNASSNGIVWPHGIETNATFDTFFVTSQYSNFVYKLVPNGFWLFKVSLDGNKPSTYTDSNNTNPNPHEILMTPDYSKYFVTCQGTNNVAVIDAHTDKILATIPVGVFPQELAMSRTKPYMFVTCMEDAASAAYYPHSHGSVYVINYNTFQIVKVLYGDFYQPHGISVDDQNGTILIASTNANPNGPAPHHVTSCGGRDGWYTYFDLNTLTPLNNRRYEVTVMPYSAATRFK